MAHGIHGKWDGRWEEKENDYENEERSRAEQWPTEYTEYTERGTGGGRRKRTITMNEERSRAEEWPTEYTERGTGGREEKKNDYENEERFFLGGGRAAGAEMAGREPLSRGAGDGGK